ncbi:magnesium transporter [Oceanithermus profundus DSM 14977]|uniref:Magnesium transporter MgtE n=1 Tax=Oceanithermus profundus (strain DSM 14977 / NBRC 100410 / VKM B-2274 / 506) TaxID=670487 RepID=E4U8W5_OCEP5|nr:magnesium transporter [Oceanithermus profundus]ADR36795.1 magnesium transporter [Oceanithermus profundus DSM 14977]
MRTQVRENLFDSLTRALQKGDVALVQSLGDKIHPQEILEHWDDLPGEHQYVLLTYLDAEAAAQVFSELDPEDQAEFLETLPPWRVRQILEELDPDDLTDALQAVEEEDPALARQLKEWLDPKTRAEVEALSAYDEDDAGGLMTPEYVAVRAGMTVDEVLQFLRRAAPDAETVYYLYVLDDEGHLVGVLSLRDLIVADPSMRVAEIMNPDVIHVTTGTDQEEVARVMADYDLTVVPVTDDAGRLVGIVTIDDVIDVLEEEATEDIHRLGAVDAPELVYSRSNAWELWSARARWLVILIVTGMFTSTILAGFSSVLEATTALAFYIPVLLGTGGNTGNQSSTLIVRALATRDIDLSDWPRVLFKELGVGVLLGLTLSALIALKVALDGYLGVTPVVALALFLLVIVANLAGALLPIVLEKLGLDPALISNPLIATISDVSGLVIYLSVARVLLGVG